MAQTQRTHISPARQQEIDQLNQRILADPEVRRLMALGPETSRGFDSTAAALGKRIEAIVGGPIPDGLWFSNGRGGYQDGQITPEPNKFLDTALPLMVGTGLGVGAFNAMSAGGAANGLGPQLGGGAPGAGMMGAPAGATYGGASAAGAGGASAAAGASGLSGVISRLAQAGIPLGTALATRGLIGGNDGGGTSGQPSEDMQSIMDIALKRIRDQQPLQDAINTQSRMGLPTYARGGQ